MIEYPPLLDHVFQALSDPTRRAMLGALAGGERSVGELAAPFDISLAAASKHIRTLERAGLVRREVRGRTHHCSLDPAPLAEAEAWLRSHASFRQVGGDTSATEPPGGRHQRFTVVE